MRWTLPGRAAAAVSFLLAAVAAAAQAPDRSAPPTLGPAPELTLPAIQKRMLSNGLPVWIVETHEVPVVQVNLIVRSGSADDPPGRYGAASLAASMLLEGAGSRGSLEIADEVDFLGATLDAAAAIDFSAMRLHVPVARLAQALPLMADVALRPTFPAEELERLRQQRLVALLQARDNPAAIAPLAFARLLYGAAHRFGTAAGGTSRDLEALTRGDLIAFYEGAYRPDRATLLVVGDVSADEAVGRLETSFGGWTRPGPGAARVRLPAAEQPARRRIFLVDKPGAAQSQIRIGRIGPPRATPDYFAIQVMNTVLGGSFSSRLNLNLREKRGYTYGAGSSFDLRAAPGPFAASAAVQTDKTAEALTEFFNELNGILKPVPPDELARAKNYVALRFPGTFETTADIARRLEEVVVYGLPDDYFSQYVKAIQAVTAADVQRVASQYVQPDRVIVVVVGDRAVIEARIRALSLGPIDIVPIDDVFAPAAIR
jgi:predicted Zn-dependent peptidase